MLTFKPKTVPGRESSIPVEGPMVDKSGPSKNFVIYVFI